MSDTPENLNRPATPPPATPHAEERNINYAGEPVTQVAFDMKMEIVNARIHNSNLLMIGVLVALAICFITLWFGYWQFSSASFNDYTQKSKELNDSRYELLQQKYDFLQSQIATRSAH